MRKRTVAVLIGLLVLAAGCTAAKEQNDFTFDSRGWGGPGLKYALTPEGLGNVIRIDSGMLVNRDFRWAEGEVSFEFLDSRDLVWDIRLLDQVFRSVRREKLRTAATVVRTGREFIPGNRLPPEELWRLWEYDLVLVAAFLPDKQGVAYKILSGSGKGDALGEVLAGGQQLVNVRQGEWNTFNAKVAQGKFTYTLNGVPCQGAIRVDPRANGQLGICVREGGPLCIRNLKLGGPPQPALHK